MISSARRFRFGGEKEAAGVAVAVMLVGTMEIECRFVIGQMPFKDVIVGAGDEER